MSAATAAFEGRFSVAFDTVTLFTGDDLARLHADDPRTPLSPAVRCDTDGDPRVAAAIATMGRVANGGRDPESRRAYLEALHDLYGALPVDPRAIAEDPGTLCVGPQREGAQLARSMGCLPPGRSLAPHAKRIPYDGGLLVGLTGAEPRRAYERCVVIDGAIATGATLIAVAEHLRGTVGAIEVFAAHGTHAGLSGVTRYARAAGADLTVHVAAIGGVLNEKYYAVEPDDPERLIIGDVGDTIADLLPTVDGVGDAA
jgi:hypothetical protein